MDSAWYVFVLWAVGSGLVNLLLSHRTRIDAFATSHPRIAATLDVLRAIGIDPWMLVAAARNLMAKQLAPLEPTEPPDTDKDTPK
jgi:hypothetical protein